LEQKRNKTRKTLHDRRDIIGEAVVLRNLNTIKFVESASVIACYQRVREEDIVGLIVSL
jgi:CHASE3 domain sensor protein